MIFQEAVREAVKRSFRGRLVPAQREKVAALLKAWVAARVNPKVEGVDEKLKRFGARIDTLADRFSVEVDSSGKPVIRVLGSDEDTLKYLRLGTRWFTGSEQVLEVFLAGVFQPDPERI